MGKNVIVILFFQVYWDCNRTLKYRYVGIPWFAN